MDLIATGEGRAVFAVFVSCALPAGITLVGSVDGVEFEFPGEIGLARQWIHRPLDREDKGWVSACVMARINVHAVPVQISIRGPHPALQPVDPDEREAWSLQEGAFYGDLFTPLDQPILWIACRGIDQAAGETGELVDRDCAEPDPANPELTQCGFIYAGDCGHFSGEAACEGFSDGAGGFYQRCHAEPIDDEGHHGHDHHHHGARYRDGDDDHIFHQVITTYVLP
ncbi:MAG TPA: hypothetical protein VHN14_03670, partial [Kofleriaceae bacterium]|jgi:hypothetical protein|nr:hypothetical protein [Kofleriaceae bacterium]